jgi:hypothetical protein
MSLPKNPMSLGVLTLTVGEGTALKEKINKLVEATVPDDTRVRYIYLYALPANTGRIFFGQDDLDQATEAGILKVVPKGEEREEYLLERYAVGNFYVEAETDGDKVLISVGQ